MSTWFCSSVAITALVSGFPATKLTIARSVYVPWYCQSPRIASWNAIAFGVSIATEAEPAGMPPAWLCCTPKASVTAAAMSATVPASASDACRDGRPIVLVLGVIVYLLMRAIDGGAALAARGRGRRVRGRRPRSHWWRYRARRTAHARGRVAGSRRAGSRHIPLRPSRAELPTPSQDVDRRVEGR